MRWLTTITKPFTLEDSQILLEANVQEKLVYNSADLFYPLYLDGSLWPSFLLTKYLLRIWCSPIKHYSRTKFYYYEQDWIEACWENYPGIFAVFYYRYFSHCLRPFYWKYATDTSLWVSCLVKYDMYCKRLFEKTQTVFYFCKMTQLIWLELICKLMVMLSSLPELTFHHENMLFFYLSLCSIF